LLSFEGGNFGNEIEEIAVTNSPGNTQESQGSPALAFMDPNRPPAGVGAPQLALVPLMAMRL